MSADAPVQHLTFLLGEERYALPLPRARMVLRYEPVTPVPGVPPSLRGVIHLRGRVVPVVDLAVRFGRPALVATPWTCHLLVEVDIDGEPTQLAMMVDRVDSVVELGAKDVLPPPPFGTAIRADFLRGMARQDGGLVLLLDVDRVLAHHELLAAGELAAGGPGAPSSAPSSGDVPT
jgi:purine-binding chemotaxis protein CheW